MARISVGPPRTPYKPKASGPNGRADLSRGISVGPATTHKYTPHRENPLAFHQLERTLIVKSQREILDKIIAEAQGRKIEVIFQDAKEVFHEGWLETFDGSFVYSNGSLTTVDEPFSITDKSGVEFPEAIVMAYRFREDIEGI